MGKADVKLGVAPINWTNDDVVDLGDDISFEHCISEMALAGYQGCEVGRKFPVDQPEWLDHALRVRGLRICNQWHSIFLLSKSLSENVAALRSRCTFLKRMGAEVVGVSEQTGSIQSRLDLPCLQGLRPVVQEDQWPTLLAGSNTLGQLAWEEFGIKMCYHLHLGTAIETEEEMRRYLDGTDPRYVSMLFDCGHTQVGGGRPLKLLQDYHDRVGHVHCKSIRQQVVEQARVQGWSFLQAVRAGLFTVPGDGDLSVSPLLTELARAGYQGWVVVEAEQDPAKANPFEYAVRARKFIQEVLASEAVLS